MFKLKLKHMDKSPEDYIGTRFMVYNVTIYKIESYDKSTKRFILGDYKWIREKSFYEDILSGGIKILPNVQDENEG